MESLILVLHIVVCVLLVILVLLQSGKEGMGVIFGGGNTSVFGSTGAGSLLAKMTAFMAVIFVCTSLAYTYVTSEHVDEESAVLNVRIEDPLPATTPAPQAPASSSMIPTAPVPPAAGTEAAPAKKDTAPEAAVPTAAPAKGSAPAAAPAPEATSPAAPAAESKAQ